MKDKVLEVLQKNANSFVSGEGLSESLNVSRVAVWKYINKLKTEGYIIESVSRKGYKLISSPDLLSGHEIKKYLNTRYIGREIIHFDTIDSTNTKAKELALAGKEDGTVIVSEEQTAGRGRFGRQWSSPKYKGIWMSIILRPNIDPVNASNITLIGAAAVSEAIKERGVNVKIKWPNDIVLNNKKLCGILTEMNCELGRINYLVIGIGINVNNLAEEFPEEISNAATSLRAETGQYVTRTELLASILNHLERFYDNYLNENCIKDVIDICRKNSILIGKEIELNVRGKLVTAEVIDVNEEGLLVIKHRDGSIENVISGEVSMHGLYGYKK